MLKLVLCLSILISLSLCYLYPHPGIQKRLYRGAQFPTRFRPRSADRAYYPIEPQTIPEKPQKPQKPKKAPQPKSDNHFIKPDRLKRKTDDQCLHLKYPEEKGEDLEETLKIEDRNIIVTVWYENFQDEWDQNKVNQNVQGTLWKCLCENHPDIIYTEADISHYNINAYTYIDLADKMSINLGELHDGPTIVVMVDQKGETFRDGTNPRKLLEAVEEEIREEERKLYGKANPKCDFSSFTPADNHYTHFDAPEKLDMYKPSEKKSDKKTNKGGSKPKYQLSEPEKAFG
ncbi:unnamed protein product [Moneuplotes crassus]|uniref:Uncharacterized protein n=1 Tax=Euplotes crassus TaxID=5936 RepID=A0AAD1XQU0_EUPCR|nr:unnamed protein product [Moneuplotes crassus]